MIDGRSGVRKWDAPFRERTATGNVRDQSVSDAWCTKDVARAYLAAFQAPVRLLVGDKHTASSPTDEQVALLQRSLPRFRVDTVHASGSLLHEEQPEAVVLVILELLQQGIRVSAKMPAQ